MCSSILNILYITALVVGAGMTIVSLATPAWRSASASISNATSCSGTGCVSSYSNAYTEVKDSLFNTMCNSVSSCQNYYDSQPDWKKAVLATMVLALLFCGLAFVWSCIACFMCCCKSCLTPPLPIFSGLACLCDIIGITIYGVKSGDTFNPSNYPTSYSSLNSNSNFGYSMWVGIGACVVLFVDTIIGIILAKISKVSPI